jgi:hypothetical protein
MSLLRIVLILIFLLSFGTSVCLAQNIYEITETDITKIEGITSASISVFGVRLGTNETEVLALLEKYPKLITTSYNDFGKPGIRLNPKKSDGTTGAILVRYNLNAQKYVESIDIFSGSIPYLVGDSKRLVTLEMADPESPLRKTFLGYPSAHKTDQWIETDYYDIKGIDVIHHNPSPYSKTQALFISLR